MKRALQYQPDVTPGLKSLENQSSPVSYVGLRSYWDISGVIEQIKTAGDSVMKVYSEECVNECSRIPSRNPQVEPSGYIFSEKVNISYSGTHDPFI